MNGHLVGPGANLTQAKLANADLRNLDLGSAIMNGADLANANLSGTNLADVIATGVQGNPVLPSTWRLVNGTLVGGLNFLLKPRSTFSGTLQVGSVLEAKVGTWKPRPSAVSYEWISDGRVVGTGNKLTIFPELRGKRISLKTTHSKPTYNATIRYSERSSVISGGLFTVSPAPVITGNSIVGSLLTAKVASWSPSTTTLFEWFADGATLGASGSTLLLTSNELGKRITVTATGSKPGYDSLSKSSAATAVVQLPSIPKVSKPLLRLSSGKNYSVGSVLGITLGAWSVGTTHTYKWLRNGIQIPFAVQSTYVIGPDDLSRKISVSVTASLTGYRDQVSSSASSGTITRGNLTASRALVIQGASAVGQTLSISPADSFPEADSYSIVWKRNGVNIKGAVSATYTLQTADLAKSISAMVTAYKSGYNTFSLTSRSTSKVTAVAIPSRALL